MQVLLVRALLLSAFHAPLFALPIWLLSHERDNALFVAVLGAATGLIALVTRGLDSVAFLRSRIVPGTIAVAVVTSACWCAAWLQAAYVLALVRYRDFGEGLSAALQTWRLATLNDATYGILPLTWPFVVDFVVRRAMTLGLGRSTLVNVLGAATLMVFTFASIRVGWRGSEGRLALLVLASCAAIASSLPVSLVLAEKLKRRLTST